MTRTQETKRKEDEARQKTKADTRGKKPREQKGRYGQRHKEGTNEKEGKMKRRDKKRTQAGRGDTGGGERYNTEGRNWCLQTTGTQICPGGTMLVTINHRTSFTINSIAHPSHQNSQQTLFTLHHACSFVRRHIDNKTYQHAHRMLWSSLWSINSKVIRGDPDNIRAVVIIYV